MPRPPDVPESVAGIKGSVYSSLLHRLTTHRGEVYPFHVGDTWKLPPPGCRLEQILASDHPGLNQYTPPQGLPRLVDLVVERVRGRSGVPIERDNVLISGGATAGLLAAIGAIAAPGDEVLLLAPHWPLIAGHVRMFGATPVPVPLFGLVDSARAAIEAVSRKATERTVALYLNTPNNPSGRVLPRRWVEALVNWAAERNLWIVFDEVYEDYLYSGDPSPGISLAPERSFSAHSFSKAYGMAGYRCGYLVGPKAPMAEALKLHTHSTYSAPTSAQVAGIRLLEGAGAPWVAVTREEYRSVGSAAAHRLGVPEPQGSSFLFLDAAPHLGPGGLGAFLEGCADDGLFAAPGTSFGPFPTHLRICFTSCPPDVVARGVEVLARRLGR